MIAVASQDPKSKIPAVQSRPIPQAVAAAITALPHLQNVTVLVVDDDLAALELLQATLGKAGMRVVTASSTSQALALLPECKPKLIITDLMMPGQDGYQFIRSLRSQPDTKDISVVVLSVLDTFISRDRSYAIGVDCYLAKPVDQAVLVNTLSMLLKNRMPEPPPQLST